MLDSYLHEVERELVRALPQEDVRARLSEIADHLSEGIQARIELGMTLDEAEREAIALFGSSRTMGREVRRQERVDPRFVRACLAVVLLWCGFGELSIPDGIAMLVRFAFLIAHANYLWASARSRRLQLRTLGIVSLAFWTLATLRIASQQSRWSSEPWWPNLPQTALDLLRIDAPNFFLAYLLLHGLSWWVGRVLRRSLVPRRGRSA